MVTFAVFRLLSYKLRLLPQPVHISRLQHHVVQTVVPTYMGQVSCGVFEFTETCTIRDSSGMACVHGGAGGKLQCIEI